MKYKSTVICQWRYTVVSDLQNNENGFAGSVAGQVIADFAVCLDDLADELGLDDLAIQFAGRPGCRRDQTLDVELVGEGHQPDHGLRVVGIATDVSQNEKPGPLTCPPLI